MSQPSWVSASVSRAVASVLFGSAISLSAVSKVAEPVASEPPPEAISISDVRKLQETIKGLHDRFEAQGGILQKNNEELGLISRRLDDFLRTSSLEPVKTGVATMVRKNGELQESIGRLSAAIDALAAQSAKDSHEVGLAIARLQDVQAASATQSEKNIQQLRQTLGSAHAQSASVAPANEGVQRVFWIVAAFSLASMLLIVTVLLMLRSQLRILRSLVEQSNTPFIGKAAGVPSVVLPSEPIATESNEPSTATTGLDLVPILAQLQSLLEQLNHKESPVHTDNQLGNTPSALQSGGNDVARHSAESASATPAFADWPDAFVDANSPMDRWRSRIELDFSSSERPARPVYSALITLRNLCGRQPVPSLNEVSAAVVALSIALHSYWDALADLTEDERAGAGLDWIRAVKSITLKVAPKLEIREVLVGDRFDSDSMQTVQDGPGSHLNVAAVFSWATLDRSGERVKVIQRARIATT